MGNRFVFWSRRHSVERLNRPGDWVGLGSKTPVVTPFGREVAVVSEPVGGSSGEPVKNGIARDLARAQEPKVEARKPGRPRKDEGKR